MPVRIVGVAPPGFFGATPGEWTDVYAPLAMRVAFEPSPDNGPRGEDDSDWWVRQIARVKPEVPEASARVQLAGLFRSLAALPGRKLELNKIPELISLPGQRGVGATGREGRQRAVDSDAAGRGTSADRLRECGEPATRPLGKQTP